MMNYIKKLINFFRLRSVALYIKNSIIKLQSVPKWRQLQKQDIVLLELGSGPQKGLNGWITVDLVGADISHDLRKGIPLPNETVDRIYTSHMFEHIPYKDLVGFIHECYRVLKKGGELSVCVPNAGFYIKSYVEGRRFRPERVGYAPAFVDTGSMMDEINYIAYMDQKHKYMFDPENLVNTLKKASFSSVGLREFDEDLDLKARDYESIYASAIK